jgi:general secretion pathway protein G
MRAMSRLPARGFTLSEVVLACAILGVIALLALPAYSDYVERTRVAQASTDIIALGVLIKAYHLDNYDYPNDLGAVGAGNMRDPWGRPYRYLAFRTPADMGKARKDKNLVPINSDFDLYSAGRDGQSQPPLTANPSRDDVVRANDGRFTGLASTYSQ